MEQRATKVKGTYLRCPKCKTEAKAKEEQTTH